MDEIAIPYQKTDGTYTFNDCIYLTKQEFDFLGDEGIESMKMERFTKWLEVINTPCNAPFIGESDG